LPEPNVADMEFFLDQVEMILPVLGFDFTQPRPGAGAREDAASESPVFELRKVGTVATAQEIDGQFVVFAGSTARTKGVPSWQSYNKALRETLVADGSLVDSDDPALLVFAENVAFNSPSAASSVVMARPSGGRADWRAKATDETYSDWQDAKLAAAVQPGQLELDEDAEDL